MVAIIAIGSLARSAVLEYWAIAAVSTATATLVLREVVWKAISFQGADAWLLSSAFAAALTLAWSGVAWRAAQERGTAPASPLEVWLAPVAGGSRRAALACVAALPLAAYGLAAAVERFDWNFLLQKLGVLLVWLIAFALAHRLTARRARPAGSASTVSVFLSPALVLLLFVAAPAAQAESALDRYGAADPSFSLVRDLLRANSAEGARFYGFLRANSTITDPSVKPIEVDFARPLERTRARRPNVFFFVVDSLRRDYLSPYNPGVTFTPSTGSFASESFVFERAYTRYGGTALSMPAMWTGGMLIHKQYIRPFRPMNALEKLIDADGYRMWLSMDHITDQVLGPVEPSLQLDRDRPEMQYDFCGTLREVEAHLGADRAAPLFVHTRALNLHISKLLNRAVPPDAAYAGFHAPAAAEIRRMDRCFGAFIDTLRRQRLYEDSIVILTSDHGDSFGEEGRWGHAYTLYPEVVRVPLVVHLPAWLEERLTADLGRPAFSTDIVPTLYALLGHQPAALGPLYGEPLFVPRDAAPSDRRRESFLVASSYGSVYGTLRRNGRELYIADAIAGRDYAYDTSDNGVGRRLQITEEMRRINRALIQRDVAALGRSYGFSPEP
jgi:hypothetical protein